MQSDAAVEAGGGEAGLQTDGTCRLNRSPRHTASNSPFTLADETSVVTDSEFASESANFSSVRPSPSPRIFGGRK